MYSLQLEPERRNELTLYILLSIDAKDGGLD